MGSAQALTLGIDLGTSGVRACLGTGDATVAVAAEPFGDDVAVPEAGGGTLQDPGVWLRSLHTLFRRLAERADLAEVARVAVAGTSGTLLLTDRDGAALTPARMYDDSTSHAQAERIRDAAPRGHPAATPTSSLAKLLAAHDRGLPEGTCHALHPADWVAVALGGPPGHSDENNAFKLGYDPECRCWPGWLLDLLESEERRHRRRHRLIDLLPQVWPAGTPLGVLDPRRARPLGLGPGAELAAGTTDGVAGVLGTGARALGDGVTTLGTTLIIKLIGAEPVHDPRAGVYSHRLGERWLCGGASNTGGGVLRAYFSHAELAELEPRLRPDDPTGLDYYPLLKPGERFPIADPQLAPRITPRPSDPARFLQGLLEGMASVEARGYARLAALGAPTLKRVFTTGGGARNRAWQRLRERALERPVVADPQAETACGAARLARAGPGIV